MSEVRSESSVNTDMPGRRDPLFRDNLQARHDVLLVCGVPLWVHESLTLQKAMEALVNAYDTPAHLRARP